MLTKIFIKEEVTEKLKKELEELQTEHKDKVKGIYELYDGLWVSGHCSSYSRARAYYVAYTLATKNIEFEIQDL